MITAGIICECNPLHEGHLALIRAARAHGADCVVCLMSGCFTQRGEPAVAEPYRRAEALLRADGGADLVLELPFPYSSAGAEFFALAGVRILSSLGVDELWFGSECGDLSALLPLAKAAETEEFRASYAQAAETGTAQAFFDTLRQVCPDAPVCRPNDILAVSYLRAILRTGACLSPRTVRREGCPYRETNLPDAGMIPSASALRARILTDGPDAARQYLPDASFRALRDAAGEGTAPASWKPAERLLLASLRLCPDGEAEATAELSGGLGNRLCRAAAEATSFDELLALAATKKYPTARLQRGILFFLCGVRPDDLRAEPAFVRLLGATPAGRDFLSSRRHIPLPVVTKHADLPRSPAAARQSELDRRARALYSLCLPSPLPLSALLFRPPVVE